MKKFSTAKQYILIAIIGALFFIPYLGEVHLFDWDEINFAEAAREMIVTGDYLAVQIDFKTFHEKPPLFIWAQVISMKIFGINEFAARFPNALMGIITLLVLYRFGKRIFDERFGLIWSLVYLGTFLPHFYFKSAIIDPYFNFFMFVGVYFLSKAAFRSINTPTLSTQKYIAIAGAFTSFAVLTKGPVGFLLVFLTWAVFWVVNNKKYIFPAVDILIFTIISFAPTVLWYIAIFAQSDGTVIEQFIAYQIRLLTTGDAGHSQPIYYHPLILMIGCFPASAFIFGAIKRNATDGTAQSEFKQWNFILLLVVVILFSIVKTKIVHYSSLAYFPITFLAVYSIVNYERSGKKPVAPVALTLLIGLILSSAFIIFPIVMKNIDLYLEQITDKFTKALLMTDVSWGYEYLIGIFFLIIVLVGALLLRRNVIKAAFVLFSGSAIVLFTFLPVFAPKIESYTQGAPIEFFESLRGEDAYIEVLGYKSYAQFFYSNKSPKHSLHQIGIPKEDAQKWLLEGNVDKPVYFVCQNKKKDKYLNEYDLELLYEKNGFVFMKRLPEKNNF